MKSTIDTSTLASNFFEGKPVEIAFPYPSEIVMMSISSLVSKILARSNLKFLTDSCITVIRELVLNAFKANAKRVFFASKDLDMCDKAAYENGMHDFRSAIADFSGLKENLLNSNLRIVARFKNLESGINVSVKNNVTMTDDEYARIRHRIDLVHVESDFNNIYNEVYDITEGAGLGIIISLLLLKNAGIDPGNVTVTRAPKSTIVALVIPFEPRIVSTTSEIKLRIIKEIDSLPTFPHHILELQELCDNPKSDVQTIATKILTDPSLTADVLKIANSAGFISGKRIDNIPDAIIIIGLNNLKSILMASTSRQMLDKKYKRYEHIWDHCNKCAFYARTIADITGFSKLSERVFIAGLLHDIGKITLLAADEKMSSQIAGILGNKSKGTSPMLEEISIGISHTTIGKLITEKWNFPEYISESIAYHHSPLNAPAKFHDIITIVYLANMLCEIERQNFDMSFIETEVLEKLNIIERKDFNEFFSAVKKRFIMHYGTVMG